MSMTLYTVFARLDARWDHAEEERSYPGAYDVKIPVYLPSTEAPTKPAFREVLCDAVERWKVTGMPGVVLAQILDEDAGDFIGTFVVEGLAEIYRHAPGFKRTTYGKVSDWSSTSPHPLNNDHAVIVFDAEITTTVEHVTDPTVINVPGMVNQLPIEIPLSLQGAACFEEKLAFMLPRFDRNRPHPLRDQFLNTALPTRFQITQVDLIRNIRPAAYQPYTLMAEGVLNILRRRGLLSVSLDTTPEDGVPTLSEDCKATFDFHYRAEGFAHAIVERETLSTRYDVARTAHAFTTAERDASSRRALMSYVEQGLDWRPIVRRGSERGPQWQLIDAELVDVAL